MTLLDQTTARYEAAAENYGRTPGSSVPGSPEAIAAADAYTSMDDARLGVLIAIGESHGLDPAAAAALAALA